jgi:hypothetical protein
MLESKYDLDNGFDLVIKKSIPFLIYAPTEYREKLVELLKGFCHSYTEREEITFRVRYESICKLLETEFDQLTGCNIHYFSYQTIPLEQSIRDLNKRVTELENRKSTDIDLIEGNRNLIEENRNDLIDEIEHTDTDLIEEMKTRRWNISENVKNLIIEATEPIAYKNIASKLNLSHPQVSSAIQHIRTSDTDFYNKLTITGTLRNRMFFYNP